ncbi:MAG: hypothetical protein FJ095_18970 [Deltaproteobacteria bacterium]|nr:hypothetical protein [Deltaproteobacteria bacterium]
MNPLRRASSFVLLLALGACGGVATDAASPDESSGRHDEPAPPDAPRADASYVLDLEPGPGCDERFDLALYADRSIERIAWDDQKGKCLGRHVAIRYLSALRTQDELTATVRKLTRRAEPSTLRTGPTTKEDRP